MFACLRVVFGVFTSAFRPLAYSIFAQIVPKSKRAFTNALIHSTNFAGLGLSSILLIEINELGWRSSFYSLGLSFILFSVAILILIKEPN